MLYFLIMYIIISLVSIKYKNASTTRYLRLMLIGWFFSLVGLLLYVSGMNEYYNISSYFSVNKSLWRSLMLLKINPSISIRLINFGVILYIFSLIIFSLKFTNYNKHFKIIFTVLISLFVIEFVFYDPNIYRLYYEVLFSRNVPLITFEHFNLIMRIIYLCTNYFNKAVIIISIVNLLVYIFRKPQISFLRYRSLVVILCIIAVSIAQWIMFSWAPRILINVSTLSNYTSYLSLQGFILKKEYSILFNIITIVCFAVLIAILIRYSSIENYYKKKEFHIEQNLNTAQLSINIFSHMIKNRLICILAEAEDIVESTKIKSDVSDASNNIINTCHECIDYINKLSSMVKSVKMTFKPVSLFETLESALNGAGNPPQNISLVISTLPDSPICLLDESHFKEVITNLVNNAIDAIGNNNGLIEVNMSKEANWGIISVTDNGCGISEENLHKIFDPFFSTKPSSKNWGVGLSYCTRVISAHGGRFVVNSRVNEGTTFKILIPVIS